MTTDDRDGTLLPFPHVALPPSRDAGGGAPPDPGGGADSDALAPVPVGSWPLLPDVSDMGPPLHMTVAGVPDPESGDDEADAGAFVPPPPADPDNPGIRDAAVMGMAVMAAVGVSCAQGMWHAVQGAKASAEQRRAVADKARADADKAMDKRLQSSPDFGRAQKAGGGSRGGGGASGSGSGGSKPGGRGGGSKAPASLRSNSPSSGSKKGPDGSSGSRSGGVGSKGPGSGHKGATGAHKGSGNGSGSSGGPGGHKNAAGKDTKAKSGGWKRSPDGPVAKENAKARNQRKAAKQNVDLADRTKDRDAARKKQRLADKDARRAERDKAKEKAKDADPAKDKAGKEKPDAKPEAKKGDGTKVDLTKKPKATEAGKDKVAPPKPTAPPKPLYDPKAKVPGAHKPDGERPWKKGPDKPGVAKDGSKAGGPGASTSTGPAGTDGTTAPPPPGAAPGGAPGGPPPGGMPGTEGMRPPPAYTAPDFEFWLERDDPPPPEPTPAGAVTRGSPALPAGTASAPTASSTPPGPAAPAVPPQSRGARFVSAPVKSTQYRDAELTVYDVIDADADMAEEITAGVDEALAAADGCERLVAKLEALHARIVDLAVPGVLEGMVIRLIEQTGEVKARADAIAAALPRASEAISTAGSNTEAIHRHPADVTRDQGHTRPADREYNLE
ncbi:hypothetical protein [Streptomyces ardesiacus]|uniref:hypothetical protein n=1 Tax=Streptomyces ardesiacus TaxID=285564 RepID=UPI0024C30BA6|nr:hypothetical protein [Streptomyces ardesiacus]